MTTAAVASQRTGNREPVVAGARPMMLEQLARHPPAVSAMWSACDIAMPEAPAYHARACGRNPRPLSPSGTAQRMIDRIGEVRKPGTPSEAPWRSWPKASQLAGENLLDKLHADLAKALWSLPAAGTRVGVDPHPRASSTTMPVQEGGIEPPPTTAVASCASA